MGQILHKQLVAQCFQAVLLVCGVLLSALEAKPKITALPQIECTNPHRFSKAQRDNIIYAYNFGASAGMGYAMAAIAWQESCAGAYMMNFSDPSAGLYHAHIPVVVKYYSSYKDSPFTRNAIGQLLIDDRKFASQVALDSLLYWHGYHKGNYKNIIKSYNKGFKWQKDSASNKLAEAYYREIHRKISLLKPYISRFSRQKNRNVFIEVDKDAQIAAVKEPLQQARTTQKPANNQSKQTTKQAQKQPKSQKDSAKDSSKNAKNNTNNTNTKATTPASKAPESSTPDDFVPLPLEGGIAPNSSQNFDANFEDFNLIFEGH